MHSRRHKKPNFFISLSARSPILAGILSGSIVFAVCWFSFLVSSYLLAAYPIKHVQVISDYGQVSQSDIQAALEPWIQTSLVSLETSKIKADLESNAWIAKVKIERRWPDTLMVKIQEQMPIATFNHHSLVNRHGERFVARFDAEDWQNLPNLHGAEHAFFQLLDMYRKTSHIFQSFGTLALGTSSSQWGIHELRLNPYQGWYMELKSGIQIRVDKDQPLDKLKRLIVYLQSGTMPFHNIASIDLRYPHGLAVKWRDESEASLAFYHHEAVAH